MTDTKHSAVEQAARAMALHAGWELWDTAIDCRHTPSGNEPGDERQYWRDLAAVAIAAAAPSTPGHLVPDTACKQGKCAMTTTGCHGKCFLENPQYTVSNSAAAAAAPAGEPVAKVIPGSTIAFLANGKDFPKPGTLLYAAPVPAAAPKAALTDEQVNELAEAAYWNFDARKKGYAEWKQCPQSERDAFKAEFRIALAASGPNAALVEALQAMLEQFTKTPSTLKDSEARAKAHAALKAVGVKP